MRRHDQIRELERFPDETLPQRQLRSLFEIHRERDLGKSSEHPGTTALESPGRAVASMPVSDPGFVSEFARDHLAALG